MTLFCLVLTYYVIVGTCNGQISDVLFPALTETARDMINSFANQPGVTLPTKITSSILADTVSIVSQIPLAVARAFGVGNELPAPFKSTNVVGALDNFIFDFNIGLENEDAKLRIDEIISKYNFPVEKHEVTTEDRYILTLFRIPRNGSVVLLMHGLLGSSDDFIIAGVESGMAYLLAEEGYDVWMGNARGNKHSRRHIDLTPTDGNFWNFSWHEIGVYDLPAMINYILNKTSQSMLKYIGHSQGTTAFFVMASEKPEYNKKIGLMIALSPVAFMSKVQSPVVRLLAPGTPFLNMLLKCFGVYEFLPDDILIRVLKKVLCGTGPVVEILCSNTIFLMAGFDYAQLNVTNLPVIYGHVPSGASVKQFSHYGQGVVTGEFRKYDYGFFVNSEKYGSRTPPNYALDKISAPVSIFYSDTDWLAHPDDVNLLYNNVGNAVDIYKIPYDQFNHMDFLWAKDFKTLIYKRLRKLLKHF